MNTIKLSKYIISQRYKQEKPINNLDLQRILKIIQDKTNCFYDECDTSAGYPVYPNIYYRFCGFGIMPISLVYDIDIDVRYKKIIDETINNFVDTPTRILNSR